MKKLKKLLTGLGVGMMLLTGVARDCNAEGYINTEFKNKYMWSGSEIGNGPVIQTDAQVDNFGLWINYDNGSNEITEFTPRVTKAFKLGKTEASFTAKLPLAGENPYLQFKAGIKGNLGNDISWRANATQDLGDGNNGRDVGASISKIWALNDKLTTSTGLSAYHKEGGYPYTDMTPNAGIDYKITEGLNGTVNFGATYRCAEGNCDSAYTTERLGLNKDLGKGWSVDTSLSHQTGLGHGLEDHIYSGIGIKKAF